MFPNIADPPLCQQAAERMRGKLMVVFWRGWGIAVLFVPLLWLLASLMVLILSGWHEPDADRAMAMIYRLGAAGLALATVTLWAITRYRERVAPGVDTFIFVPMRYWTYVVAFFVAVLLVMSFFPVTP